MKDRIYLYEETTYQLLPEVKASVMDAARRWNADLSIVERITKRGNFWMQKQNHVLRTVEAKRVLWLDGDILIRADAPNPFDYVPEDKIGFVSVVQDHRFPYEQRCPQGGFQLYNPRLHREILLDIDRAFRGPVFFLNGTA